MSSPSQAFRKLARDLRGVSAIEFAFILPVMLTLCIGTAEVSQGVSLMRKVTLTAHTVADLVSRQSTIGSGTMTDLFAATTTIIAPYQVTTSNFTMVVSQVQVLSNGTATIYADSGYLASCGYNTTAYSAGQSVTVPSTLVDSTQTIYLIWGQASYTYTPVLIGSRGPFFKMIGPVVLSDQMYMAPRQSGKVAISSCS